MIVMGETIKHATIMSEDYELVNRLTISHFLGRPFASVKSPSGFAPVFLSTIERRPSPPHVRAQTRKR